MSHPINDQWIESAYEMFQEAVQDKNYQLAESIIHDSWNNGFYAPANQMREELLNTSVGNLLPLASPYA